MATLSSMLTCGRFPPDVVLGPVAETSKILRQNPSILNRLPYTTAVVIKEALRLFPPASAMRGGEHNVHLKNDRGNLYPTGGMNVCGSCTLPCSTTLCWILDRSARLPAGALARRARGSFVPGQGRVAAVRARAAESSGPDAGYAGREGDAGHDGA